MMTINDNEESGLLIRYKDFFRIFAGEYVTVKQVATARYYRNHKLMAEIFNDTPVPDTRSGIPKCSYYKTQ